MRNRRQSASPQGELVGCLQWPTVTCVSIFLSTARPWPKSLKRRVPSEQMLLGLLAIWKPDVNDLRQTDRPNESSWEHNRPYDVRHSLLKQTVADLAQALTFVQMS